MRHVTLTLIALAALGGCREGVGAPQPTGAPVAEGSATAPAFTRGAPAAGEAPALAAAKPAEPAAQEAVPPEEAGDQEPEAAAADEPGKDGEEVADAEQAEEEGDEAPTAKPASLIPSRGEIPAVEVQNVGMHVGGGTNTAAEKAPIRATVSKHYDDLARCYGKAHKPAKDATFGVDLRIPGEGGAPKVSKPRSGLKGEGVTECMVSVFEAIEFPRQPKGQPRMVSYSVRFQKK